MSLKSHTEPRFLACEKTTSFSFLTLIKKVKAQIKKKNPDFSVEQVHEKIGEELKEFTLNEQRFEYEKIRNHLGGYRWYVICPRCGNSAQKLYLPSNHPNREQRYLCMNCHRLKNASSLYGATNKYKKVFKPLKRMDKIKTLLLKRGITTERARELLDEYERLERELKVSPEYRLWEFRKKNKMPAKK